MFNDKNDLIANMIGGINDGTLVSPKHSVASLGVPTSGFKTVVVPDKNDLAAFFQTGLYSAKLYQNSDPRHNDDYVVVTPKDSTYVAASGVPPRSTSPSHPCDVFVAVSGVTQGLHLFGEESTKIQSKISSGELTFIKELL